MRWSGEGGDIGCCGMGKERGLVRAGACCCNRVTVSRAAIVTLALTRHHFLRGCRTTTLFGKELSPLFSTREMQPVLPRRHTSLTSKFGKILAQMQTSSRGTFYSPVRPTIALREWYGCSLPQEMPTARDLSINPK